MLYKGGRPSIFRKNTVQNHEPSNIVFVRKIISRSLSIRSDYKRTENGPLHRRNSQFNLRHNCTFLFFVLLLFTSVQLELTFFSIDTRQSVCRRLPTHDCLSVVTSSPSGMYVCLWREQTTDGRCLFGAFVTSYRVYRSNLRKIPKAMKLSKKNITTTRTGSIAECASCMHRQTKKPW